MYLNFNCLYVERRMDGRLDDFTSQVVIGTVKIGLFLFVGFWQSVFSSFQPMGIYRCEFLHCRN